MQAASIYLMRIQTLLTFSLDVLKDVNTNVPASYFGRTILLVFSFA